MKRVISTLAFSLILLLALALAGPEAEARTAPFELQAAIDAAEPGDVIRLPAGLYRGNFTIDKPLTLEGTDWPILDGNNEGHVIQVEGAPQVTIRNLVIRNSGNRLDKEHAGIAVDQSPRLVVENNRLENILFGIYIKDSEESRIAHNVIGAKALEVPARGDGIRVWYSARTEVIGNRVDRGRDVVLWYNNGAVIRDNVITNGRYGLHFMYCDDNLVERNRVEGNSVGAFLMYSRRLTLRHNIFANNRGPSGYGIGLKDMDGVEAIDNLFSGNRVGIYFDNSPWSIDVRQHFQRNAFVQNDIGLLFNPSVKRNYFSRNSFIDNLEQAALTGRGNFEGNEFTVEGRGNFWSDYAGYDEDGDGRGDLPYVSQSLFENMMDNHPALRLFQLSPAQQAVDLAARAFPIFLPEPKFVDRAPLMNPIIPAVEPAPAEPVWPLGAVTAGLLAAAGSIMAVGKIGRPFKTAPRLPTRTNEPVTAPGSQNRESTPMITVKNLTKRFGQFTAVDNLSFEIGPGEAVALWGPNGAGKTTIIRSLLGLHRFDGELRINGFDVVKAGKQARAAVGYVPQELAFYPDLTTAETLRFFAALKQIPATRIETVLTEVGLVEQRQKAVAALSGGMKQRLALAVALLADPPLLFLDEPTSSLDTKARHDFIALLLKQKQRGKTLLFTSHRLEEVEQLATRILVLQDGRLELVCARPADLAGQLGLTVNLKLIVPEPVRASALDLLQTHGFTVTPNGVGLLVAISPTAKMAPLQTLMAGNIEVENFEIENGLERLAKNGS